MNKYNNDAFFPPPWQIDVFKERTAGWIEFQNAIRSNPEFYLSEFLKEYLGNECCQMSKEKVIIKVKG